MFSDIKVRILKLKSSQKSQMKAAFQRNNVRIVYDGKIVKILRLKMNEKKFKSQNQNKICFLNQTFF